MIYQGINLKKICKRVDHKYIHQLNDDVCVQFLLSFTEKQVVHMDKYSPPITDYLWSDIGQKLDAEGLNHKTFLNIEGRDFIRKINGKIDEIIDSLINDYRDVASIGRNELFVAIYSYIFGEPDNDHPSAKMFDDLLRLHNKYANMLGDYAFELVLAYGLGWNGSGERRKIVGLKSRGWDTQWIRAMEVFNKWSEQRIKRVFKLKDNEIKKHGYLDELDSHVGLFYVYFLEESLLKWDPGPVRGRYISFSEHLTKDIYGERMLKPEALFESLYFKRVLNENEDFYLGEIEIRICSNNHRYQHESCNSCHELGRDTSNSTYNPFSHKTVLSKIIFPANPSMKSLPIFMPYSQKGDDFYESYEIMGKVHKEPSEQIEKDNEKCYEVLKDETELSLIKPKSEYELVNRLKCNNEKCRNIYPLYNHFENDFPGVTFKRCPLCNTKRPQNWKPVYSSHKITKIKRIEQETEKIVDGFANVFDSIEPSKAKSIKEYIISENKARLSKLDYLDIYVSLEVFCEGFDQLRNNNRVEIDILCKTLFTESSGKLSKKQYIIIFELFMRNKWEDVCDELNQLNPKQLPNDRVIESLFDKVNRLSFKNLSIIKK